LQEDKLKIAICTTTFNRPQYVKRMVDSLKQTFQISGIEIQQFVRDDMGGGEDNVAKFGTSRFFTGLSWPVVKNYNLYTQGADKNTLLCFEDVKEWNPDFIVNLDSDMIVKPNWVQVMVDTWKKYESETGILSGFNTLKNHKILETRDDVYVKNSLGGAGMMIPYSFLQEINLLGHWRASWGNSELGWDFKILEACRVRNKKLMCTKPSVFQHIGEHGIHTPMYSGIEADKAEDFEEDCPFRSEG